MKRKLFRSLRSLAETRGESAPADGWAFEQPSIDFASWAGWFLPLDGLMVSLAHKMPIVIYFFSQKMVPKQPKQF